MRLIDTWKKRAPEEANLFNPAFGGSILYEFTKEYQKSNPNGAPITLLPISMTLVLHRDTRTRLPHSTITSMYDWLLNNEDTLIGFEQRTENLIPYFKEALRFSLVAETLEFAKGHLVVTGVQKAHFSASLLRETTPEVRDIANRTKFVARWFAKSGSEASILASWGVRP